MSTAGATAPAGVRVREVAPGESLAPFIDLAWTINAGDPQWVPPLRMALRTLLDRRKHPFHQHADVAYFVAEQAGRPVGRIAAVVNHLYNDFHGEKLGSFGFFECVDDEAVAGALVEAAAAWLRARGMERMRGPLNFSTNEEGASPGTLVDGFDTPPAVMMTHNPRYYPRLLESTGLAKVKDLLAYEFASPHPPERLKRLTARVGRRGEITIRPLNLRDFRGEVDRIKEVYNAAWARNWGFVPMTDAEFDHVARELKGVVDPDICLIAEENGEPVGFAISLPDLNQALRHLPDGRLFPFGIFKFLWHRRKIARARLQTFGFKPAYQNRGLGAAFYLGTFRAGPPKGYVTAEASWILEDNWDMRSPLEKFGATVYKRYRVYERAL